MKVLVKRRCISLDLFFRISFTFMHICIFLDLFFCNEEHDTRPKPTKSCGLDPVLKENRETRIDVPHQSNDRYTLHPRKIATSGISDICIQPVTPMTLASNCQYIGSSGSHVGFAVSIG